MIRIGIVGIGSIAEEYISILSDGSIKGARISALASRNEDRVKGLMDQYGLEDVQYYATLDEMLEDNQIDGVLITTPNFLHKDMAKKVIEHKKHCIVDKPLGITTLQVDELVSLANQNKDLTLAVMFNCRSNPIFKKVKNLVDSGDLGELRRVNWQVTDYYRPFTYYEYAKGRGTYEIDGGGVLMNQAIHHLDLMLWFTGMPKSLMAFLKEGFMRPMETENDVSLTMFYNEGATGQFLTSTHESPGANRLELSFSKGQIVVEDDYKLKVTKLTIDEPEYTKSAKDFFVHIPSEVETETFEKLNNRDEHTLTIQNFVNTINGEEELICNFDEGAQSIRVINGAYLSHATGEKISLDFEGETYQKEFDKMTLKGKNK